MIVEEENIRIDKYLSDNTKYSRTTINHMLDEDYILVNDKHVKPSYLLKKGDVISIKEGYIKGYDIIEDGAFKTIRIALKYGADKNEKIISGLQRISKPGLRVYASKDELPRVLGGLGVAIISTNKGVVTDKEARKLGVGGEVLCFVW